MGTHRISRRRFQGAAAASVSASWLDSIAPAEAAAPDGGAARINPLIGASTSPKLGEGKTFPGPASPFGLVQLSPDTITGGDNAPGYSYDHTTIEGFSFIHMSGVGWYGDFGNLQTMATTGPLKLACGRLGRPREGWRSRFRHETERASAGYYAVTLDDYGIRAELTAAARSGMLRFTFPGEGVPRVQVDLARRIAGTSTRQYVKVAGKNAIEGWMRCPPSGGGWGNGAGQTDYTVYFRMEFSAPLEKYGVWSIAVPEGAWRTPRTLVTGYFQSDAYYAAVARGEVLPQCAEREGAHLGFFAEFPALAGNAVLVKAGVSFASIEGARANLAHDFAGWDFDGAAVRCRAVWDDALAGVRVEGGTAEQNAIFATALYHAMIDPRIASDVNGNYTAAGGSIRVAKGYTRRTIFSGWDVFRAEFPLMTILRPDVVSDEINSLVALAGESGKGYLERWEIVNAYSGCMDGDPAVAVIADAWAKGIRTFDSEKAFAACRQTVNGTGAATNRPANDFYLEHGWVPDRVSWTLDNAYYDWCAGTFAAALGKDLDAEALFERARNFRKIYDPEVKSMRARDAAGNWMPWKGRTVFGQGCTESNPGQQTWFVPHDVEGLIELMGREEFCAQLEEFFGKTPPGFAWNDYYNHANEPVHHVPYLFVYAGKPWLTQKWVRRILDGAYHDRVDGICGNDDVGQMSAWYVLSAVGFYPVCPGDNTYIIGSPVFEKVTMRLDPRYYKGGSFTVLARNHGRENCYIRSAKLNGREHSRAWITHEEITGGSVLELSMSDQPNPGWGSATKDAPPSMSKPRR